MPGAPIDVAYPLAGEKRSLAYQSQAPYSSIRLLNSWPRDVFEGRMRGGSRPGLRKAFPSDVAGPIHLLANVRIVEDIKLTTLADLFTGTSLGHWWTPASWRPHIPLVSESVAYALNVEGSSPNNAGIVLNTLGIDVTDQYEIWITVLANMTDEGGGIGQFPNGEFSIFARMDDTSPNVTQAGLELRFIAFGTWLLELYKDGALTASANMGARVSTPSVTMGLRIKADNTVTAVFQNNAIAPIVDLAAGAPTGERVGFGINGLLLSAGTDVSRRRIDNFRVDYTGAPPSTNRNVMVVAGGTNAFSSEVDLQYEDTVNTLVRPAEIGKSGGDETMTNDNARQLQAAELLGKLYVVGEDAQDAPSDAPIWVFDATGAGSLIAMEDETGFVEGTPTRPVNCTAIAAWNGRLCVVSRDDPHNVSMARVGIPYDWAYAAIPVGSAVQLNTTGIDAGKLGEPVNALIAHSDDYLLMGLLNSLYVMRGEPTLSGQLDRLSSNIGIVAPQAWARGPNGETVFLSNDGVYSIAAGVLSYPESISRESLPNDLRDIDVNNYRILMAYDVRNRGVFIGITPILAGGGSYFWFDWEFRGFYRMEFPAAFEPTALVYRNADSPLDQRLLFGCRDGQIRTFDDVMVNDDGVDFSTEVVIGPINLGGGGYYDGMILEIIGQTAIGSDDVTMSVQTGKSVEDAFRATPRFSRTLRAGKNITHRPRLRGNACFVRLSTTSGAWALENLTLVRERLGKQRL